MYHPTSRVLTVLELLQSRGGLVPGSELAQRLETDVRTIRRYILKLQDVGIPIESVPGPAGGYRLKPGHRLPPLLFTPEEGMAAFLSLMGSSWLELGQNLSAVEGALSKIARVMPTETRLRLQALAQSVSLTAPGGSPQGSADVGALFDLSLAVQERRCVSLEYVTPSGEASSRLVEPYGLAGRDGRWYLVAWCRMRQDYRTFRLDRLGNYRLTEDRFVPKKGFDYQAYARAQLDDYHRKYPLVVWFRASPDEVRSRMPAGSGTAEAENKGCLWTSRADDLDWAAHELLLKGWDFEVRQPEELKAVLRASAARALASIGQG